MQQLRSIVWNYFTKTDQGMALCTICNQIISYKSTITNLKVHLRRRHRNILAFENVKLQIDKKKVKKDKTELSKIASKRENSFSSVELPTSSSILSISSNSNTSSKSAKRRKSIDSSSAQDILPDQVRKEIDRDFLNLFIKDLQPFRIVEDSGFRKLMKWISAYEIPDLKTISSVMIPSLHHQVMKTAKQMVGEEADTICITVDFWTSIVNESYIAIIGHYINKEFELKSVLLRCCNVTGHQTAADLGVEIKSVIEEWNLENKVNFAISDNTKNMKTVFEEVLKWDYYACYANKLNSIVQRSLQDLEPILEKIKKFLGYFDKSKKETAFQLPNHQINRLIQDVPINWKATYYMLQLFIELEDTIEINAASMDDFPIITDEEWQTCKQVLKILTPFEEMTKSMSDEKYMLGSSVIAVTRCLKIICEKLEQLDYTEIAKKVTESLDTGLEEKFKCIETNSTFSLCTLLDPRYKDHVFQDRSILEALKDNLQLLVVDLIDGNQNQAPLKEESSVSALSQNISMSSSSKKNISAWDIFDNIMADKYPKTNSAARAVKEITNYFVDDILPRLNDEGKCNSPLDWWKTHQHVYPNLAKLFRTKCNIVATLAPCERLFSKTENSFDRRKLLTSDEMEMLVFLNGNSNLIQH